MKKDLKWEVVFMRIVLLKENDEPWIVDKQRISCPVVSMSDRSNAAEMSDSESQ